MKDVSHHIRSIQRKIIRLSRKEALEANHDSSLNHYNNNHTAVISSVAEIKPLEKKSSKKNLLPKKMKMQSYH
jgi:hypothetical protein